MRISEIKKMPQQDFPGGKKDLDAHGKDTTGLKPLPGSKFQYNIISGDEGPTIQIWDPEGPDANPGDPHLVGALLTNSAEEYFPLKGAVRVQAITVDEDYRGQGIANALYKIVLDIMKRPLISGFEQTPGGRKNWFNISQMPGVEVNGFVKILDKDIHSRQIDLLMGKLGAQYIGQTTNWGRLFRFFAFDIRASKKSKELVSTVRSRLSKIYNEADEIVVGLYAVRGGK